MTMIMAIVIVITTEAYVARKDMVALMRLLQFTDSTFPVGTFSFSNSLETASFENIVTDAASLEAFTRAQSHQAAYSDGVAAIHTHRAFLKKDYDTCREMDRYLIMFKMNSEARLMIQKNGEETG